MTLLFVIFTIRVKYSKEDLVPYSLPQLFRSLLFVIFFSLLLFVFLSPFQTAWLALFELKVYQKQNLPSLHLTIEITLSIFVVVVVMVDPN